MRTDPKNPIFLNEHATERHVGETLIQHADRLGLMIPSSCGRHGSCRECIVAVMQGDEGLSPRTEHEQFLRGEYRLACQARVLDEATEIHVHALRRGTPKISSEGRHVEVARAPAVTRTAGGGAALDGRQIATHAERLLGLAADIGTTTVVLRVVDLETGELVATHSFENPQMFGGSNVLSRIAYDGESPHHDLQHVLIAYINRALGEIKERTGVRLADIFEVVAVGNATMRDIFLGLDVQGIGRRPFRSVAELAMRAGERPHTAVETDARALGLNVNRSARVYGAPVIACHVGADTTAGLAALGIDEEARTVVLIDIGTNTELVIGNRERLVCASCPAGPAFEGHGLTCGMPGLEGAIERIHMDGTIRLETIGGVEPVGICGSGLIDAMSGLIERGEMSLIGHLVNGDGRFYFDREHDIYITDRDLSLLAQAKAANIAGVLMLARHFGIEIDQVDRFYFAGGFAQHVDLDHAMRIGLLPVMDKAKVEKVGNAAIEGATAMLLSRPLRERMERITPHIEHIELEADPRIFEYFVEGCQFKPSTEMSVP